MDPVYDQIYGDYYSFIYAKNVPPPPTPVGFESSAESLRKVIDDADAALPLKGLPRLRSDAKYLLLANFAEMILRPVLQAQKAPANLMSQMEGDIRLLIDDAATHAKGAPSVSAHSIIDALARSWKQLSVMSLKIWE